jgi:hypothetical protein
MIGLIVFSGFFFPLTYPFGSLRLVKDSESASFSVQLIFTVSETFFFRLHLVSLNLPFLALPLYTHTLIYFLYLMNLTFPGPFWRNHHSPLPAPLSSSVIR